MVIEATSARSGNCIQVILIDHAITKAYVNKRKINFQTKAYVNKRKNTFSDCPGLYIKLTDVFCYLNDLNHLFIIQSSVNSDNHLILTKEKLVCYKQLCWFAKSSQKHDSLANASKKHVNQTTPVF